MKQLQKYTWLIALAVVVSSLISTPSYAYGMEEENEIDGFKVTGKFFTTGSYDFKLDEEDQDNKKRIGLKIQSAKIGLKKKFPLGDDDHAIEFVMGSKLSTEGIKLGKLYIDHEQFRVGLAASKFCDPSAMPNTLIGTPDAIPATSTVQIGWKGRVQEYLSYGIAAEKALDLGVYRKNEQKEDTEVTEKSFTIINNIPSFTAHVQYEEEVFGYIRLGGLLRILDYSAKDSEKISYQPTWGVNLTTALELRPEKTKLKVGGVYGLGIGNCLLGFASVSKEDCKDIYVIHKPEETLKSVNTVGGYAGLEHHWLPELRSTIAYGILDARYEGLKEKEKDEYEQKHYASVNLTYHPTDHLMFGLEYLYGNQFTESSEANHDQSIQAVIGFEL